MKMLVRWCSFEKLGNVRNEGGKGAPGGTRTIEQVFLLFLLVIFVAFNIGK